MDERDFPKIGVLFYGFDVLGKPFPEYLFQDLKTEKDVLVDVIFHI
jgi:hypothetical protein